MEIEKGKTLHLKIIAIGEVNDEGKREVFCEVNGQLRTFMRDDKKEVQVNILSSFIIRTTYLSTMKANFLILEGTSFCISPFSFRYLGRLVRSLVYLPTTKTIEYLPH